MVEYPAKGSAGRTDATGALILANLLGFLDVAAFGFLGEEGETLSTMGYPLF
jgi:hypothetical protein